MTVLEETFEIPGEGEASIRVRVTQPSVFEGGECFCLLFSSGLTTRFDETPDTQPSLFNVLRPHLRQAGLGTIEFDWRERSTKAGRSTEEDVGSRIQVARTLLRSAEFHRFSSAKVVWIGLSLGGTIMLHLLSGLDIAFNSTPELAILISTVIEKPITIYAPVKNLLLLYGERDHIVYVDEDSEPSTPIPAAEFGRLSSARLVVRKSQLVVTEIIPGVGHLLTNDDACPWEALEPILSALRKFTYSHNA